MKVIRYLLLIPACLIAIGLLFWVFGLLMEWYFSLSMFWIIFLFLVFSGTIWGLFKNLSGALMNLVARISPNKYYSFYVILILSILAAIRAIYLAWSQDINYTGGIIFCAVFYSILVIQLALAFVYGTIALFEEEKY